MPRIWTDQDVAGYCTYLQSSGEWDMMQQIDGVVDNVAKEWENQRRSGIQTPFRYQAALQLTAPVEDYSKPGSIGYRYTYLTLSLHLPDWIPEELLHTVIRAQLHEQLPIITEEV